MSEFFRIASTAYSLIHVLLLFFFIYNPRYSRKKTIRISCAVLVPLFLLNLALYWMLGDDGYGRVLMLTLVFPCFVYFFLMAKYRDFRFVFSFCIAGTVSAEVIILSMLAGTIVHDETNLVMFLIRLMAFPIMEYLLIARLRKPYFEVQNSLPKGWGLFSLVTVVFYVLLLSMSVYPTLITQRTEDIPIMLILMVLMPLMYLNIFQVLAHQNRLHTMKLEQDILHLQTVNMEQRINQITEAEERFRIERHDLRHRFKAMGEMLQKGEYEAAQEYIDASVGKLEATVAERFCVNPILDAVFSSYFKQARAKGIRIDATLAVPNELPVDAIELSIVMANALENAIIACEKLPEEKRVIHCKCVNRPQLMFQISNPFTGKVLLDEQGRPITKEKDHGVGTRSILAFCEKNGAFVDYKVEDDCFYMRIVISE